MEHEGGLKEKIKESQYCRIGIHCGVNGGWDEKMEWKRKALDEQK